LALGGGPVVKIYFALFSFGRRVLYGDVFLCIAFKEKVVPLRAKGGRRIEWKRDGSKRSCRNRREYIDSSKII
jgi:hypothetical protein